VGERILPNNTSVYIASRNGNINTTIKVMDSIFIQKKLPMPFNFLNTVNSIKLFYVAKHFELEGKAIFVDRFESALPQAFVDVKNGKTVLLGIVTEAIADPKLHREKFGAGEIEESSRWLLLSPKIEGVVPIAIIDELKLSSRRDTQSKTVDLFSFLENNGNDFLFKGK
jgi:hypothetical protein